MARGKRRHPTESMGVMSEINTVHAFGKYGQETSGWPYHAFGIPGFRAGPNRVYRPARLSQDELGSSHRRRRRRGRR